MVPVVKMEGVDVVVVIPPVNVGKVGGTHPPNVKPPCIVVLVSPIDGAVVAMDWEVVTPVGAVIWEDVPPNGLCTNTLERPVGTTPIDGGSVVGIDGGIIDI